MISKYNFISIRKTIIENYNISFILLLLSSIIFLISWIIRVIR